MPLSPSSLALAVALVGGALLAWRMTAPPEVRLRPALGAALAVAVLLAGMGLLAGLALGVIGLGALLAWAAPASPAWVRLGLWTPEARRAALARWAGGAGRRGETPAPQPELEGQEALLAAAGREDHRAVLELDRALPRPQDPELLALRVLAAVRAYDALGAPLHIVEARAGGSGELASPAAAEIALLVAARRGNEEGTRLALGKLGHRPGSTAWGRWVGEAILAGGDPKRLEEGVRLLAWTAGRLPPGSAARADIERRLAAYGVGLPSTRRTGTRRPPVVTAGLMILLAGVYGLEVALGGEGLESLVAGPGVNDLARLGGNFYPATFGAGETWRLLASTLLHGNLIHLLVNGYALLMFGSALERRVGRGALLFVFVLTGLAGSLASSLLGSREAVSVGASGAIFGLLGFVSVYGAHGLAGRLRQLRANLPNLALIYFVNFLIPNVDNLGHLGGLLAGLGLGLVYRPPAQPTRLGLGLAAAFALAATAWRVLGAAGGL